MLSQLIYFAWSFLNLWTANNYSITKRLVSLGFPFARASANLINFNSAMALLSMCRNLITALRSVTFLNMIVPFDSHVEMHLVSVIGVIFWSIVHVVGHSFNYSKISQWTGMSLFELLVKQPTGLTGVGLAGILIAIVVFSLPIVRRKYFHIFYIAHYLFVFYLIISSFHGAFCFIQDDDDMLSQAKNGEKSSIFSRYSMCDRSPSFWKWLIAPVFIYICEKLIRVTRSCRTVEIQKVIQHPSNTVEIQVSKVGNLKAGQYAFINCPEIGITEWHPFTASSSPLDNYVSFHIFVAGDWTSKLAKRLGCDFETEQNTISRRNDLPKLKIDGFYGAPAEDVFNYQVSVLIGAGIGVSPFASILREIWNRHKFRDGSLKIPKKVFFIWIARDTQNFEWFQSLLKRLEEDGVSELLDIRIFLTQHLSVKEIMNISLNRDRQCDVITGLESRTQFGRPNLDSFFQSVSGSYPGTDVGVFCCGPKSLSDSVGKQCTKYTHSVTDGTRFHFKKENF
jgi:NADPH oxidase